jgi:hypothetical protein
MSKDAWAGLELRIREAKATLAPSMGDRGASQRMALSRPEVFTSTRKIRGMLCTGNLDRLNEMR